MNRELFNKLLKEAHLSKKDFAAKLNISYTTVNGWGSTQNIPYWVESWLQHYIKSKKFDEVIDTIKPFIKVDNDYN